MHLASVGDAGDWVGSGSGTVDARSPAHLTPRRIFLAATTTTGLFGGTSQQLSAAGETEAFVCTRCGYLEEYLKSPRDIDWSAVVGATPHRAGPTLG